MRVNKKKTKRGETEETIDCYCGTSSESNLDLTFKPQFLAGVYLWEVTNHSTVGSDYYPILCKAGSGTRLVLEDISKRWVFGKANSDKFREISETKT